MFYVIDNLSGEKIYKSEDEHQVDKFILECIKEGKDVRKDGQKVIME